MNDTSVTFHGWVGGDVRHRIHKDVSVATIRVGVTPRIKREGEWVDGETLWYSVTAWRTLADHVSESVHKGDAVIVHGRLRGAEVWAPDGGQPSTSMNVEALLIGHDLTRGRSHFFRDARPQRKEGDVVDGAADETSGSTPHGVTDPSGYEPPDYAAPIAV